ncbi:MAG TPA: tRNA (adenosine(37)-N6)-threonylcarbamoyltransferase complex ATPase subunit type 1 TsaE [Alphaproteobacteria bacterium]|nr:tRNA (adenosine(37)-N6)-threonylcarbamoyltransferase complex ATPase subunit type 1 TsaE [Alphaproteobacteria bacterium]HNS43937.1 tRNA (adenosine(37)-N6)-threonylcarbamoyltransferase complex ATPase subunit type 1 TsaE [Alphaproteobacteria bacterium]
MVFLTEEETIRFAADFTRKLKPRDVVLLRGDLGAGKSVFARSVIRALSDNPELEVPSPTFTLVQTYDTSGGEVWHFDLYRLKDADEIFELGWEDALAGGIVLVEWPERLGPYVPENAREVNITIQTDGAREVEIR